MPQSQVFLVGIDFEQPDDSIAIGTLAQVKIHCEYRSVRLVGLSHRRQHVRPGLL